MTAYPLRMFPDQGVVACFVEAAGGGDMADWDAPRNAPAKTPASYLANLRFHSTLDYYRIAAVVSVTINHASVAGASTAVVTDALGSFSLTVQGQSAQADHLLLDLTSLALSAAPRFMVAYNGMVIPHGFPIQRDDAARMRFVSAYATSSAIRLKEVGYSSASALSTASRTYTVIVFEAVEQDPDLPLFFASPGFAQMGRGMFDTSKRMIRVARTGDTPFGILLGRGADWRGGGVRFADAAGNTYDFGAYAGSFSAPASIGLSY